jgi:lipoprotein-releasing system permease protein
MLGLVGAVMGSGLGSALLIMFTSFAKSPDGSPIINISFDPGFILFSGFVAVAAAVIASLIPAAKSKKLSPIEVIRNG